MAIPHNQNDRKVYINGIDEKIRRTAGTFNIKTTAGWCNMSYVTV